jgi:hypothetical protein
MIKRLADKAGRFCGWGHGERKGRFLKKRPLDPEKHCRKLSFSENVQKKIGYIFLSGR